MCDFPHSKYSKKGFYGMMRLMRAWGGAGAWNHPHQQFCSKVLFELQGSPGINTVLPKHRVTWPATHNFQTC